MKFGLAHLGDFEKWLLLKSKLTLAILISCKSDQPSSFDARCTVLWKSYPQQVSNILTFFSPISRGNLYGKFQDYFTTWNLCGIGLCNWTSSLGEIIFLTKWKRKEGKGTLERFDLVKIKKKMSSLYFQRFLLYPEKGARDCNNLAITFQ